jgi:glycosyltransferase involved in cell wall biosynthesis
MKTLRDLRKKLNVFLVIPPSSDCGIGYYRMVLPMWEAEKNGEINLRVKTFTWGEHGSETPEPSPSPTLEELAENCKWADVVYWARNDIPAYIANMGGIREWLWNTYKLRPAMIMDIDDNIFATRPYNPGYRSYFPNSPHKTWNIKSVENFDAITVSTKNLSEVYTGYNPFIGVCPNSMPVEERDKVLKNKKIRYPKKDGEIRIGWSGSASHWENLKHIEQPVIDILKKYPQTTFYITGLFGDLFQDPAIKDRVVSVSWSQLKDWVKTNVEMDLDIALAPLVDNDFNRAKSNLRILEYATAKYPVIASPVEPYKSFTSKEVMFATEKEEWFNAMEKLIKKPELRLKLSTSLYKRLKSFYNINRNYKLWITFFKKILKEIKKTNK